MSTKLLELVHILAKQAVHVVLRADDGGDEVIDEVMEAQMEAEMAMEFGDVAAMGGDGREGRHLGDGVPMSDDDEDGDNGGEDGEDEEDEEELDGGSDGIEFEARHVVL